MADPYPHRRDVEPARSFELVADVYDRARPSYPPAAAEWLVGSDRSLVLEVGAGTGKLTTPLTALGHAVTTTDRSAVMLRRLARHCPTTPRLVAAAENLPVADRSVDAVVAGQAFHWFDARRALQEAARVLRDDGVLGLVWNRLDERIPWVRRLASILAASVRTAGPSAPTGPGAPGAMDRVVPAVDASERFGPVDTATFRFWQPLNRDSLRDLVRSRSVVALLSDLERERLLRRVDELYDEYGRGADGMLLPYVTHTYRATVRPRPTPPPTSRPTQTAGEPTVLGPDDMDTDALLIDFR